jgi:hypothetical protein
VAARTTKASAIEVQIPIERQKAAQAAGMFELADLPEALRREPSKTAAKTAKKTATKTAAKTATKTAAKTATKTSAKDAAQAAPTLAAAIRVGKLPKQDQPLKLVRTLGGIAKLHPGQVIANYGKSEQKWSQGYDRRQGGTADFISLLSYARQIIAVDPDGRVRICLMGHAGQGPCIPLWVPRDDVTLTVQPNDIILRFDDIVIDW